MKNKLIILTLLLSIFSFGCEIEKDYDGPTEPYEVPPKVTNLDTNDLSTFNGLYRITFFKKVNTTDCLSYPDPESDKNSSCETQKPFTPLAIKGYVYLEYSKENNNMAVAYKYDMYDKDNTYFTKTTKSNSLSSYKYQNIHDENTFSNFQLDTELSKNSNKLTITSPNGNKIPNLKLVTDNGATTYNFELEKVQDITCLQDTHTPHNIALPFKNYKLQTPINLSKEAEEDKDVCMYGEANPNDAVSLMAYYEVTRMQIYDYDTDDYKNGNNVIYDTDTRENNKKFKGEFWITNHPTKQLLESDKKIYLQAAFKYQVDSETKLTNISFPLTNTNNPLLLDISIPLQEGDYFIIDTFALVAQWDSASPQRTRQVIFKPEDKSNAVTIEAGGKKYIAVLTLERLLNAFGEGISTPDGKINFFKDYGKTPLDTPYWN